MTAGLAAGEQISRRLQESLACLRKDIDRVELWADALNVFSQPIPEYRPQRDHMFAAGEDAAANVDGLKTGAFLVPRLSKRPSGN